MIVLENQLVWNHYIIEYIISMPRCYIISGCNTWSFVELKFRVIHYTGISILGTHIGFLVLQERVCIEEPISSLTIFVIEVTFMSCPNIT